MSTVTPNVVVSNPTVRRVAQWVIGTAALLLPTLAIVQSETALDFSTWLPAATGVSSFLAGAFGIAVVVPNIPSQKRDEKELQVDYAFDLPEDPERISELFGEAGDEAVPTPKHAA